jgi:hypothetical protein
VEDLKGFKLSREKIEETFSICLAFSPDQNSGLKAEWATQFRGQEKQGILIKLQYFRSNLVFELWSLERSGTTSSHFEQRSETL